MGIIRKLMAMASLAMMPVIASCAEGGGALFGGGDSVVIVVTGEGEHRFRVELADDDEERRIGLMYREHMDADTGMLFDFGEPQAVSMWMKNTLIPLDMAFIKADGEIHRIAAMTTPRSLESIASGAPVTAVLEVNGGVFAALGIEAGDRVRHPIFQDN